MIEFWHKEAPQNIAAMLKTDLSSGLSETEAHHRLNEFGLNVLTKQNKSSAFKILLLQFNSLVIWVLLGAVIVSFALNEKIDAIAIFAIVILNAIIGFVLEYRADRAIYALQQMAAPTATVIRDGHAKVIRASHIVRGDILLLESGDLIAADGRLYELASLKTNEAPLTGESLPVEKDIQSSQEQTPLADRKNMVFMGTAVADGTGRAIVVSTGMQTEMGHIAKMLGEATRDETPLQTKLNQVGKRLLWVCFAIIISIFTLGLLRGIPLLEIFMSSVSLAVAAIPEGLPAVVTVALAIGVQRMVRRDVLVRRLSAVETMGCLQVICTDKTGTLTVGEMTARKLVTSENIYVIQGEGYHVTGGFLRNDREVIIKEDHLLLNVLRATALCNNAEITLSNSKLTIVGDPTEIGMLVASAKAGIWRDKQESLYPRIKEFPFNSQRKRMSVICQTKSHYIMFVKGAPEIILERCTHIKTKDGIKRLDTNDRAQMLQSCKLMAKEALRILAVAERLIEASSVDQMDENSEDDLVFLGLIGLQDPPHAEAKEAVRRCKDAGIKPVMITGDHPDTARAIAEELGILISGDKVITGAELEKMSDDEFFKNVKEISVYARVTAENKLKIVRAWKSHHIVVAMTGDGVNDAPALKESSVGIAMGKTGTTVTKEAADVIVLDNNFSSIVAGIEEGRTIYDNIAKSLKYLLAGNAGELMVVFAALLIGWPLPLLPIQLLWINLITDGLPAIALATDRPDTGILKRPPRSQATPFMDAYFFRRVIFIGALTSAVTLGAFAYEYIGSGDLIQARDAAFSVLVTAELLRAFGARSDTKTVFEVGLFSNMRLFLIISISFLLQIMIHHVAFLQKIFRIEPVTMSECFAWIILGSVPLIVLEINKLFGKRASNAF
jgi:Ca2+-transporting ATPase